MASAYPNSAALRNMFLALALIDQFNFVFGL